MIKAKHHFFISSIFNLLTIRLMRKHFSKVTLIGNVKHGKNSVLLIQNHVSWWDGFWALYLNLKLFGLKFHFMMLEKNLRKHWYFNYCGGFSIQKNDRSIIQSLDYTNQLLKEKGNLVLMFPQGKIHSAHQDKIIFQSGIQRVINHIEPETEVYFVAFFTDYLANKKPELRAYLKQVDTRQLKQNSIELLYQQFFSHSLEQQKTLSQ